MFKKDDLICHCNSVTFAELVALIKKNNIKTLDELLEQDELPVGDKCEYCHEEGYDGDGKSLAAVLALVLEKKV